MKKTRAYTLAEIVITIIVIAIVAAITVKASRAKLDSIITYTYYAGYSTIKTVASQMMVDFSSKEYAGLDPGPNEEGCSEIPIAHEVCNGGVNVCEAGYEYKDGGYTECINIVRTVPRVGKAASKRLDEQKTFCEKFAEYVNTNENSDALAKSGSNYVQCSGSQISPTDNDFSAKKADLVLRNGMRIYNASQDPSEIEDLDGIGPSDSLSEKFLLMLGDASNNVTNSNAVGYTLYIDIDGASGPSTKWQDVFPIYVTLSGKVIPAFSSVSGVGGADKKYLQTSVERVDGKKITWPAKSVSFRESACKSGYIPSKNPTGNHTCSYCSEFAAIPLSRVDYEQSCDAPGVVCRMKIIKPIKGGL